MSTWLVLVMLVKLIIYLRGCALFDSLRRYCT
jgi:hypothetical protein